MHERKFSFLAYALILVGYMTLTISLPLVGHISTALSLSHSAIQQGIGLIFFTFSISAIVLSTLSDILGAARILKVAQIISIAGLIIAGFAESYWIYMLACLCIGLGTGCYSSISRSTLTRHLKSELTLKKSYSYISICVVIAPILAAYLGGYLNIWNWRAAYICMAILEIFVFIFAWIVLRHDNQDLNPATLKSIVNNFINCLKIPKYTLNLFSIGFCFAIFIQVLLANTHFIMMDNWHLSLTTYNIIILCMSLVYIVGIFVYRTLVHRSHSPIFRFLFILIMLIGIMMITLSDNTAIFGIIGIWFICFSIGGLAPLSTASAMANIKSGYGAAAAMLTFSFSITAACWSFIQSQLSITHIHFVLLGLWVSICVVAIVGLLQQYTKK